MPKSIIRFFKQHKWLRRLLWLIVIVMAVRVGYWGHHLYNDEIPIKNTVKSPFTNTTASFEKQTFISKVGIYDENRNLIAIAKLAQPVRKREEDSYTFKLKLDL